jgi:hypothetical protein
MSTLQVQAIELEIPTCGGPDLLRMLESPLNLSVRTPNIRVRLSRISWGVIDSLVAGLLAWVHGSDNVEQQLASSSVVMLSPPPQIPVPQQHQPHRTLSIHIYRSFNDFSWTKNVENFVLEIMKVKYNFMYIFYKC